MKAFILAAGVGTRLRPLTFECPKPMIPLLNKPVIEHTINNLKKHNIDSVVMNLHTLPEQITDYFGNGKKFGININYSMEETLLGTAGGLKKCKKFFDSTFVVMSGDGLSNVDLTAAIAFHKKKKALATMIVKQVETRFSYGITLTDKSGKIVKFVEKPTWSSIFSNTVNTGIYIFEPEVFKYIPDNFYDFGKDLWPRLLKLKKPIYAYLMSGYWTDIGNIEEYKQGVKDALFNKILVKINGKKLKTTEVIADSDCKIDKTVKFIGKSIIGKNCKIGKNVVIDNGTVIGNNVQIKDDAIIKDSIIWDNTIIGKHAKLCSSIIGINVPGKLSVYNGLLFNIK